MTATLAYGFRLPGALDFLDHHSTLHHLLVEDSGLNPEKMTDEDHARLDEECPVDVVSCGGPYSCWVLVLRGAVIRGASWDVREVDPLVMRLSPSRITRARAWCLDHGVAWPGAAWILFDG